MKEFSSLVLKADTVTGGEESVPGYVEVSATEDKTETKYVFRNQLADGNIAKTVVKQWLDAALEDARPASVTVKILSSRLKHNPQNIPTGMNMAIFPNVLSAHP